MTLVLGAHAVHGAMLLTALLGLAVLLVAARPRRAAPGRRPRAVREQQLARLRAAATRPRAEQGPAPGPGGGGGEDRGTRP